MAKAPAVQFYVSDFLTGTTLMTNEEVGLYIRLLCLQVENGSVPDDADRMSQVYGPSVPKLWKAVRAKFIAGTEPGTMVNVKMAGVLANREAFRQRQSEKGKASAEARLNHGSKKKQPRFNHGSTTVEPLEGEGRDIGIRRKERASEPDTVSDDFEALWIVYERYGAKGKALAYYRKLAQEDRDAIHAKAAEYVASTPGCEYRKQLEGWINPDNRLWERPIVKRTTATNGQQTDEQRRQERNRIIAERYAGQ